MLCDEESQSLKILGGVRSVRTGISDAPASWALKSVMQIMVEKYSAFHL